MRRRLPLVAALAALACALSGGVAQAGPNRCATSGPPQRSPTWTDGTGTHWFDQHGVWTQGPDGPPRFGDGGVDFDGRNAQLDLFTNHAVQAYVSPERQCAIAGDVGNAPATGEFGVQPAPEIVDMPWLHRSGDLFEAQDGRTTILRGVDYAYDQEIFERPYDLTDADFARIASWGFNLLRIRISGYRSGYLPDHAPEPGYWEHLDQLIAAANRHGLYVLPATVTGDTEDAMADTQAYERLKFVPGSPNRAWWIAFEAKLFARYRDWPGVVGFDTINEDDSYPPYVHDRVMMGPAHEAIDAALRERDSRHVYFQEPSGWSYWGADYWPGMMNGVDIGDPNRFFCPKWKTNGSAASDLDTFAPLAAQSDAPMFMCEMWVNDDSGRGDRPGPPARRPRGDGRAPDRRRPGHLSLRRGLRDARARRQRAAVGARARAALSGVGRRAHRRDPLRLRDPAARRAVLPRRLRPDRALRLGGAHLPRRLHGDRLERRAADLRRRTRPGRAAGSDGRGHGDDRSYGLKSRQGSPRRPGQGGSALDTSTPETCGSTRLDGCFGEDEIATLALPFGVVSLNDQIG
jgi:hypothetical protein